ncbi:hypothetical protein [Demequina aurantiaca]|uniref:hypothetical protein n=1 Tax=Demequina aurantiaca TaxID=676200 RepID=UPI003D355710
MKQLRNLKRGAALALALALTVTIAGPSYATNGDGREGSEPRPPKVEEFGLLGDNQCESMTVEAKITTTVTPYMQEADSGEWVLDRKNSETTHRTDVRKLTKEEASPCSNTAWVVWTLPESGCTGSPNIGFDNASGDGTSNGWSKCNTSAPFPQTEPLVMTQAAVKEFTGQCGTWYQADKYRGSQAEIDALVDGGNGALTYSNGQVSDRNLIQKWFFVYGGDCALTPEPPVEVDDCAAVDDSPESAPADPTDVACSSTGVLGEPPVEDVTVVLGAAPLAEAPSAVAVTAVATFAG